MKRNVMSMMCLQEIKRLALRALCVVAAAMAACGVLSAQKEVAVFITIGQSNADGSAFFDPAEDELLRSWYESPANDGGLNIWYRSTKVVNTPSNALGQRARWCVDGDTTDVAPGWLSLWYRNENSLGRTAMNMIHGYGTYSTGDGTDCAAGRRGMEGAFGMVFHQAFPDVELYVLKLGVSGSFISSWADSADDTNWRYFYQNIYMPAIQSILDSGRTPKFAGVWWMQGCADSGTSQQVYAAALRKLISRCREQLHFPEAPFYIGLIPERSVGFSPAVRSAQTEVASEMPGVRLVDTSDCSMQYEPAFRGEIHFSHRGVNLIGSRLADRVISDGPEGWAAYKP